MTSNAANVPPAVPSVVGGSGASTGAGAQSGGGGQGGQAWFDNGSGQPRAPSAAGGAAAESSGGAGGETDATPAAMAIQLPVVPCGSPDAGVEASSGGPSDAGEDASCVLPPSTCRDSRTLEYYSDGRCTAGRCEWTVEQMACPAGCNAGGCILNITL